MFRPAQAIIRYKISIKHKVSFAWSSEELRSQFYIRLDKNLGLNSYYKFSHGCNRQNLRYCCNVLMRNLSVLFRLQVLSVFVRLTQALRVQIFWGGVMVLSVWQPTGLSVRRTTTDSTCTRNEADKFRVSIPQLCLKFRRLQHRENFDLNSDLSFYPIQCKIDISVLHRIM
jgi:hypothetical protein